MEILNLSLPATNRFATEYLAQTPDIQRFFHYRYNDHEHDQARLAELSERSFKRSELADYINRFMSRFPSSKQVQLSIDRLKQENSVVVIGGQQAGILTGPLYSIHKIISVIKLAKEKEQQLGIPVIPVFWIAGEDHDYQEVNHLFLSQDQKIEKWTYPEKVSEKRMVSDITINREQCSLWIEGIFETFGETEHTKQVIDFLNNCLETSMTYVDFFATIIMHLFKEHGLLIVDSGDPNFRVLNRDFMLKQLKNFPDITKLVLDQQERMSAEGFAKAIDLQDHSVNLFFYDQHDRTLLEFDPNQDEIIGKYGKVRFSTDALIKVASDTPEKLSNNVVTRPLTQDWLFPTLAFIAGPGEIAYWAELQQVFEFMGIKMPPLVPRLNITLLERAVESDLGELNLDLLSVLKEGTNTNKVAFLESIKDQELETLFLDMKRSIAQQYEMLDRKTKEIDRGLLPMLKKNEDLVGKQIDFLERRIEQSLHFQHDVVIRKYDRIEASLRPLGAPQERILNIFYFFNQYGLSLIDELLELPMSFDGKHKLIKL